MESTIYNNSTDLSSPDVGQGRSRGMSGQSTGTPNGSEKKKKKKKLVENS